jgi:large subunit ribosomal protein L5
MAEKKEKKQTGEAPRITGKARYEIKYRDEIVPALMKDFGYSTVMQAPRMEKIVVNMGVGNVREDPKQLDSAIGDMVIITGQKPIKTRAKKSISNFKIREDWEIGAKVTLRGRKMYDFLDRFINIAVPRIRDFRGLSVGSFDGRGNYSTGMREQLIFPEIEYDKIDKVRGMDITFVTTARDDKEGHALLKHFGMPFAAS